MKTICLVIGFLFFINISQTNAINCYLCNDYLRYPSGDCQSGRNLGYYSQVCPRQYTNCMTFVNTTHVFRTCANQNSCNAYYPTPAFRSCNICNTNNCNYGQVNGNAVNKLA